VAHAGAGESGTRSDEHCNGNSGFDEFHSGLSFGLV
jgi:hypothetical protein